MDSSLQRKRAAQAGGAQAALDEAARARAAREKAREDAAMCPGTVRVAGYGNVSLVNAKWNLPQKPAGRVEVLEGTQVLAHMTGRSYFAAACTPGAFNHSQYAAVRLLGRRFRWTVDLSGVGCGCSASLYLMPLRQNSDPSQCSDHYCDATKACGAACLHIGVQEANQYAWSSSLHAHDDAEGSSGGYGGGYGSGSRGYTVRRDWTATSYGPGAECIDTLAPFQVAVEFATDGQGAFAAMEVTLSQEGSVCHLSRRISNYTVAGKDRLPEISAALRAGMTPVVSYWSSDDLLWLDGRGAEGRGPCGRDQPTACPDSVQFYDFSLEDISAGGGMPPEDTCPGTLDVAGFGAVSLVNAKWNVVDVRPPVMEVHAGRKAVPHMSRRTYFGHSCAQGRFDNAQYVAMKLLGKRLRWTVDLSGTACGCNAAFYLTSMRQNYNSSVCSDYYCDANKVCGVPCTEVDLQEANVHAWFSTLHAHNDGQGAGGGYGGGFKSYTGRRDWKESEYGPDGSCINTSAPFQAATSFPVDRKGTLAAMEVTLSQEGHSCTLSTRIDEYTVEREDRMLEISAALEAGMTPVLSYWSDRNMLWMDGPGKDGKGPCDRDRPARCSDSVSFSDISLEDIEHSVVV